MKYCIDTSALVNAWTFWYARQTHPTLWTGLEDLASTGMLKMPEAVYQELQQKTDALAQWCRERKDVLVAPSSEASERAYRRLVNQYPALTGGLGLGADYADLYVVALAQANDAWVVTDEDPQFERNPTMQGRKKKNYKITNVCFDLDVTVRRTYGLLGAEGWTFRHT